MRRLTQKRRENVAKRRTESWAAVLRFRSTFLRDYQREQKVPPVFNRPSPRLDPRGGVARAQRSPEAECGNAGGMRLARSGRCLDPLGLP